MSLLTKITLTKEAKLYTKVVGVTVNRQRRLLPNNLVRVTRHRHDPDNLSSYNRSLSDRSNTVLNRNRHVRCQSIGINKHSTVGAHQHRLEHKLPRFVNRGDRPLLNLHIAWHSLNGAAQAVPNGIGPDRKDNRANNVLLRWQHTFDQVNNMIHRHRHFLTETRLDFHLNPSNRSQRQAHQGQARRHTHT